MSISIALPYHPGEQKMHALLHLPSRDNPTVSLLTQQAVSLLQRAPLLAIGTLDAENRPWTSIWGGASGFSEPLGGGILGTRTIVDGDYDPVVQALVGHVEKGEMATGGEKMVAGLTIDLMTRKRVKIFGRVVAGCVSEVDVEYRKSNGEGEDPAASTPVKQKQDRVQLITKIEQSLGNCPKYLNQYDIRPVPVASKLVYQGSKLSAEAKFLILNSDMFFLSSATEEDMDTNHRGGPAGFVRILSDTQIVYPEYSGNRLYQTLGNLQLNPKVGLTFPNYTTGSILYTTGTASILIGKDASSLLPGSNLAVKIDLQGIRLVDNGLAFRGVKKDPSPYNPLVRPLPSEGKLKTNSVDDQKTAQLTKKQIITPDIARFTFSVKEGISYSSGQWIAFDFSSHLDMGYSHMRNDDPQSLNDDFVRTFTISSTPNAPKYPDTDREYEFEITIRNVGTVTNFLFQQSEGFEVPIVGIGGEFYINQSAASATLTPFIAGGVGITPLLGQMNELDVSPQRLRLLWTVKLADAKLAVDVLRAHPGLAPCTDIFFTGGSGEATTESGEGLVAELKRLGARLEMRRMLKADVDAVDAGIWYLCTGNALRKDLLGWLEGKVTVFESFDY
jgi:NAD(P)H-flavin reductase/predicted pyridoxine 5'-phosphate oxidase superfamily flavin-nucleotide-binding protein